MKELLSLMGVSNISYDCKIRETSEEEVNDDMVNPGSSVLKLTTKIADTNQSVWSKRSACAALGC